MNIIEHITSKLKHMWLKIGCDNYYNDYEEVGKYNFLQCNKNSFLTWKLFEYKLY
jgi:hypothetical protein